MVGKLAILPSLILALLAPAASAQQAQPATAPVVNPSLGAAKGSGTAAAITPSTASGDVVLASAVSALGRYNSVAANVRQRIRLFGHDLFGSGQYLQHGAGPKRRFRMEMTIQGKRQKTTATRICDGRLLWLLDDQGGQPTLRVVDLRRVEDALTQADLARAVDWRRFDLGFGGLPRLLAACEENFQFGAATPSQLNDVPVWVLRGHWKPARLNELLAAGKDQGKSSIPKLLPPQMPNEVVLFLGRDDLFPYCVEFRSVSAGQDKQGMESHVLAGMDFFEVRVDTPVDETQFIGPANMPQTDDTESFLTRLGIPRTPSEIRAEQGK